MNTHNIDTPVIGDDFPRDLGDKFYNWLGTLWKDIYTTSDIPKSVASNQGLELSQLYLNTLECLNLQSRNNIPIFHREQWYPIIVRKSQQNKSNANFIKISDTNDSNSIKTMIGDQPASSVYKSNELSIGKHTEYKNVVAYPIDPKLKDVLTCITDSIIDPKIVLLKGVDFDIIDNSIVLSEKYDPFSNTNFVTSIVIDAVNHINDSESVIWASNALIDQDLVKDHLGYILGIEAKSTELYKNAINAILDLNLSGCSVKLFNKLIAVLCNIPCISDDNEVVSVITNTSGSNFVITSHNSYTIPSSMKLSPYVKPGAVLSVGTFLTSAVKIYPFLTNIEQYLTYESQHTKSDEDSLLEALKRDVPVLPIKSYMLRCSSNDGFSLTWDEVPIRRLDSGDSDDSDDSDDSEDSEDSEENYYFQLEGDDIDISNFWKDVWAHCKANNISLKSILGVGEPEEHENEYGEKEQIYGMISPMKFFLENLVGMNTLIITVDLDQLDSSALLYDPDFFSYVRSCLPSHIRLFFIEHALETDEYELSDTEEDVEDYAHLDAKSDYYDIDEDADSDNDEAIGNFDKITPRYKDNVISKRWIPACKDQYD